MNKLTLFVTAVMTAALSFASMPKGFTDDFDAALKSAEKSGKKVLAVFTGSDWCIWCKRLDSEVLSQPGFTDSAVKSFELVFLDFPQDKSLVSEKTAKRNQELAEKYGIKGYPTVLVLDSKGDVIAQTGYQAGGSENYLKHLGETIELAPLVEKHLGGFRKEVEDLSKSLSAEVMKAVAGSIDRKSQITKYKAKLHELSDDYRARIKDVTDRLIKADIPEKVADRKASLARELAMMLKMFDWAAKDDAK